MSRRIWQHYDLVLLASLLLLLVYGVAVIYSASHAIERVSNSALRQAVFAAAGLVAGLVITAIDYRLLDTFSVPFYVLIVVLLLAVFVIGQVTFNAQRSIDLGIIDLQPSELSKPLLIIVLAAFLAKREEGANNHLITLLLSGLLVGVPVVLIYREPDLGTSLVLIFIWLAMIFASGIPLIYLGVIFGGGLVAVPFLWLSMEDYMRRRVVTFLNPAGDPQSYYNIQQARFRGLVWQRLSSWHPKPAPFSARTAHRLCVCRVVRRVGHRGSAVLVCLAGGRSAAHASGGQAGPRHVRAAVVHWRRCLDLCAMCG
jgi:rod shape determining protein RodA